MEKRWLKQVAGIDVAAAELVVSLGRMDEKAETGVYASKAFANTESGFTALLLWVRKQSSAACPVRFVMEATGVYHEAMAYFLWEKNCPVSIIMPNKISSFFKTLNIKTVTDKSMSVAITLFGLEKQPDDWQPPGRVYRELRQLTRERDQLCRERTMLKNQLHAEQAEAWPARATIVRIEERIVFIGTQMKAVLAGIKALVKEDAGLGSQLEQIMSIPGIGLLTAAVILAETGGFALIRSKKQLSSYAGLDVREKESGTSVKGKPRISKRGNRHLRKAMHLPALAAIRHSEKYKAVYTRIVSRSGIKMKAVVAVQRKLLEMTFTIYKTAKAYDEHYPSQKEHAAPATKY
jgi:transposase